MALSKSFLLKRKLIFSMKTRGKLWHWREVGTSPCLEMSTLTERRSWAALSTLLLAGIGPPEILPNLIFSVVWLYSCCSFTSVFPQGIFFRFWYLIGPWGLTVRKHKAVIHCHYYKKELKREEILLPKINCQAKLRRNRIRLRIIL